MRDDPTTEVLLVEDNPADVELTLRALRKAKLVNPVRVVGDGAAALEILQPADGAAPVMPRVILLDLKLPKVDGLEVLRRLKGDARTRTIPVVVLSSSREEGDLVRSYEIGANSYVVKPVEFDEFVRAVSEIGLYWLLVNEQPR
jgi:CheY-like chemotaxis protein